MGGGLSSDGGLYLPKWTSTTYSMLMLRDFGHPANNHQARTACTLLLDGGLQRDGGINYGWRGRSETCITGMVLSILSYFEYDDHRLRTVADHLLEQQMADGGWNCRRPYGATHASVHTTISVLEGLRLYELQRGGKLPRYRLRSAAVGSSFWCIGSFVLIEPGKSSSPYLLASPFRRGGITTSFVLSITSNALTRRATNVLPRRSTSSGVARGRGRPLVVAIRAQGEDVFRA